MQSCGELNILCVGELMAGKSTFLEGYTSSDPSQEHFKVFLRREQKLASVVYLQEVEEREGGEVYLRGGFDGVLFFVKIDHFHNTVRNVLESLAQLSAASGANLYKIPIRAVVISNKNGQDYDDIAPCEQRRFQEEVSSLLTPEQIIFVESGRAYEKELSDFYRELLEGSAVGIKETTYSNWFIKGATGLLSFDHFKLQAMRLYDTLQEAWLSAVKRSPLKWRDRFLWLGL